MCSDSEQASEGNELCLIFSSYHFRNKKKRCRTSCILTVRVEFELSCSLFSRLVPLHHRVNPRACASTPRLQSRGPCSAPDTVSVNTKWWRKTEKEEILWHYCELLSKSLVFVISVVFPVQGRMQALKLHSSQPL